MDINLVEIWAHMGLPVRAVVVVLTLQVVHCRSPRKARSTSRRSR